MKVMELLKKDSSKFVKTLRPELTNFHWQDGYGMFSVSESHVVAVRRYIETQEEHHRKLSFKEQILRLLQKNNLDYDEKYLWD